MAGVRVLTGYRVFKDSGAVATDATATFYLAGTSTLQEVFSDKDLSSSLGSSVSASATNGVFPDIWVSDAISVKVVIAATGYTSDTIDYLTVAQLTAYTFAGTITPLSSDGGALGTASLMWSDLFLASGGVCNWNAGDVTITHSANLLTFAGASSGYKFDASILPVTSDGAALGSASLMFSDAFFASGAVLNFNASDVTITHSANALAFAGASSGYTFDAGVQAPPLISSEVSGTLTSASKNKKVNLSGGATLPASGMSDGDWILLDPAGTARTITRPGAHTMYVIDTDSATATTRAYNVALAVYHGSSKWTLHGTA